MVLGGFRSFHVLVTTPDSGFFTCDPTEKCIMHSSRERHKGIIGRGHDLRLIGARSPYKFKVTSWL